MGNFGIALIDTGMLLGLWGMLLGSVMAHLIQEPFVQLVYPGRNRFFIYNFLLLQKLV